MSEPRSKSGTAMFPPSQHITCRNLLAEVHDGDCQAEVEGKRRASTAWGLSTDIGVDRPLLSNSSTVGDSPVDIRIRRESAIVCLPHWDVVVYRTTAPHKAPPLLVASEQPPDPGALTVVGNYLLSWALYQSYLTIILFHISTCVQHVDRYGRRHGRDGHCHG
jgi:hypothetical protein